MHNNHDVLFSPSPINLSKISNIIDNNFNCQGYVRFDWVQPGFVPPEGKEANDKGIITLELADIKEYSPWLPGELLFLNATKTEPSEEEGNTYEYDTNTKNIQVSLGYDTLITHVFELQRFPFDRQYFTLQLQTMQYWETANFDVQDGNPSWMQLCGKKRIIRLLYTKTSVIV